MWFQFELGQNLYYLLTYGPRNVRRYVPLDACLGTLELNSDTMALNNAFIFDAL